VPGTVALVLAAQFRRDAYPAEGFLTGASMVRRGERLAWIGILIAVAVVLAVAAAGLLRLIVGPPTPDFDPTVD
jgi:hydroxylaminobenzene mutase